MKNNLSFIDLSNHTSDPSDVKAQYESNPDTNALTDSRAAIVDATTLAGKGITDAYTKTEVDNALDGQNEAIEISYDNSSSGLNATNVKDAVDELGNRLDTSGAKLATIEENATGDQTPQEIKTAYESNADTNALTDALKSSIEQNKIKSVDSDVTNNTLTFTYIDDTTTSIDLTSLVPDVHVSGAVLDATTSVLTLSSEDNGADVTVDLSDFVNSSELTTALSTKVDKVISTDNAIVRFDGIAGDVQNSDTTLSDDGSLTATAFIGDGSQLTNLPTTAGSGSFAQHGLVPNAEINEIRPQDMFMEIDVANTLVDKKGYPVRFTDRVYDRLGAELIVNGDFSSGSDGWTLDSTCIETISDGKIVIDRNGSFSYPYQQIQFIAGHTYRMSCNVLEESNDFVFSDANTDFGSYAPGVGYYELIYYSPNTKLVKFSIKPTSSVDAIATISNVSVRELPQFSLPLAPFATGSTDELLDDKVNGLTTQTNHSKGDIIVTGNELVTNGTFDTDIDGWEDVSADGGTATYSNGTLALYRDSSGNTGATRQIIPTIPNVTYNLVFSILGSRGRITIRDKATNNVLYVLDNTTGSHSSTFVAVSNSVYIETLNNVNDTNSYFDNISVKLKEDSYIALQDSIGGNTLDSMPELVTNGDFSNDITGWEPISDSTLTASNNELTIKRDGNGNAYPKASQNLTLASDKYYVISTKCVSSTSGAYEFYLSNRLPKTYTQNDFAIGKEISLTIKGSDSNSVILGGANFSTDNTDDSVVFAPVSIKELPHSYLKHPDYFKPIPYVTKQVALLIEKTSNGQILNTVKPLVNMYGEDNVLTYEEDVFGELGYIQKVDRVYTDGSSEFILLGLKGYLA